jgi:RHS repeat-associated protein
MTNRVNLYTNISGGAFQAPCPANDDYGNQINAQIHPQSPTTSPASLSPVSCVFSWDAQNRLIEVKDFNNNSLVKHHYDSYSRKIATITSPLPLGEGQGAGAQLTTTLYIYNGWNSIAEYRLHNSSFNLHTSLLWGLDLSGSMQGAGGVGGLLCLQEFPLPVGEGQGEGQSYYPCYDGNGNITEYLDSNGVIAAHYEYDAFGNTTVATGAKANDFTYRFSTKPIDRATGLYYYGYRFYDTLAGRWSSKDPIDEKGGFNLYQFVLNHTPYVYDYLGNEPQAPTLDKNGRWRVPAGNPAGGNFIKTPSNNIEPSNKYDPSRGIDGKKPIPNDRGAGLPNGSMGDVAVELAVQAVKTVKTWADLRQETIALEKCKELQATANANEYHGAANSSCPCNVCNVTYVTMIMPHGQKASAMFDYASYSPCKKCSDPKPKYPTIEQGYFGGPSKYNLVDLELLPGHTDTYTLKNDPNKTFLLSTKCYDIKK